VTVSAELEHWLVRDIGVPRAKVEQIINGVDCEKFCPALDKIQARATLGIPADKMVVGIVGRLDPVKDHATLLRSMGQAADAGRLVIVGAGPAETDLRSLAAQLNLTERMHFLGARDDIAQVMGALDVFVLPSLAEGISNTILEAMACGVPVIASRVGGSSELVVEGETGFLFEAGQAGELAGRLERYLYNPELRQRHGLAGRLRAKQQFSLSAMVGKYERLYRSLMTT
jgi:glycosyltransferase involved in cell wall biosynthesis